MKFNNLLSIFCLGLALNSCSDREAKADNTARNWEDNQPTAQDQSETDEDRAISQRIRRALVEDRNLSSNGRNIKIITYSGVVTLRGPVYSRMEKNVIEEKARNVPGVTQVNNNLEIISK